MKLAVAVLLSLSCATAPPAPTIRSRAGLAYPVSTTCLVDGDVSFGRGSAVAVSPDQVLTAYHVVDNCPDPVILVGEELAEVELVAPKADVARLRLLTGRFHGPFARAGKLPEAGDEVCLVPSVPHAITECGMVVEAGDGRIEYSALTVPGNSGSGLYDRAGSLVGVVVQYRLCGGLACGGVASTGLVTL